MWPGGVGCVNGRPRPTPAIRTDQPLSQRGVIRSPVLVRQALAGDPLLREGQPWNALKAPELPLPSFARSAYSITHPLTHSVDSFCRPFSRTYPTRNSCHLHRRDPTHTRKMMLDALMLPLRGVQLLFDIIALGLIGYGLSYPDSRSSMGSWC